jgi:hypothetical protein
MSKGSGRGQEEVWRRFAEEIGAHYVPGDFWEKEQIVAAAPPWIVTFEIQQDTLTSTDFSACTRLTARYVATDGFSFSVLRRDAIRKTDLPAMSPPVMIGDDDFDRRFSVTDGGDAKTRELLSNDAIRAYLMAEPYVGLTASRVPGSDRLMELTCVVPEVANTRRRLLRLFELMGETLQHLRAIGVAADVDPTKVV